MSLYSVQHDHVQLDNFLVFLYLHYCCRLIHRFSLWCSCVIAAYCGLFDFLFDPSLLDSFVRPLPIIEHPTLRAMAWAAAHRDRVLSHPLCVSLPYMVTGFLKKMPPPCQRFPVGRWPVALPKNSCPKHSPCIFFVCFVIYSVNSRSGHDRSQTFGSISHALVPKLTIEVISQWFCMVLRRGVQKTRL